MSVRAYFVISFALFTIMCVLLAVNAWLVTNDLWPIVHWGFTLFFAMFAALGAWWTFVACFTRYKKW